MIRKAEFSACGNYRYTLTRQWGFGGTVCWILLNPSTADAQRDDPTNRRGINFSKAWGYGGCVFVNLFAYRATDPKVMLAAEQPVGTENDAYIVSEANAADLVVIGWGNHGAHRRRDVHVLRMLENEVRWEPECLGVTNKDQPKHPLYLSKYTKLEPWSIFSGPVSRLRRHDL